MKHDQTLKTQADRGRRSLILGFGGYAAVATAFAGIGGFTWIDTNLFAFVIVAATAALIVSYYRSPAIAALAKRMGPYGLAGFHVWRIPAALTFFYYGWQGQLPKTFVMLAGWGDLLAGVLAVGVLMLPRSRRLISAFHVIGFVDFVVAVGTGITINALSPTGMAGVVVLPVALIPLVGVPLSGATHVAAFDLMWRTR